MSASNLPVLPDPSDARRLQIGVLGTACTEDSTRLELVGSLAFRAATTQAVLRPVGSETPTAEERSRFDSYLSPTQLAGWARALNLITATCNDDKLAIRIFNARIGIFKEEHGWDKLQTFVDALVNPRAPTSANDEAAKRYASLLNERAQQNKCKVVVNKKQDGPSHNLTWNITIELRRKSNDELVEQALGSGATQSIAKEEAARRLCVQRNWAS